MRKHQLRTEGIGTHRYIERYSDLSFDLISSEIQDLIWDFEQKFSRFRSDSLLSELNEKKEILTQDVDFFEMLRLGTMMESQTFWFFSLFVASALQDAGYGQKQEPTWALREKKRQSSSLILDQTSGMVVLQWDKLVDLGGIGKGYLIGLIAKIFEKHQIEIFRINGWGDILIRQENLDQLWEIHLQNPQNPDQIIGNVQIKKGACCGSGTTYRSRIKNHQKMHHLIDPHTQKPAQSQLLAIYVVHEDIVLADMLATTLFVAPFEKIESIARKFNADFLLIFDDLSSILSPWFPFIW